jgi:hypothetical protein
MMHKFPDQWWQCANFILDRIPNAGSDQIADGIKFTGLWAIKFHNKFARIHCAIGDFHQSGFLAQISSNVNPHLDGQIGENGQHLGIVGGKKEGQFLCE